MTEQSGLAFPLALSHVECAVTKRWLIAASNPVTAGRLAESLKLPVPLAQALLNRGYQDVESAQRFLNPRLRDLEDPFALPDMAVAVERVWSAVRQGERIVIYGDYDVDGVTASALLTLVLRTAGGQVIQFVPHRLDEGYGLSADGVARCLRECQPELLLAVDCGTSSVREVAELQARGVDVIILDHHEPSGKLPAALAVINPKRSPPTAPRTAPLASVGVAFKLAHALLKTHPRWGVDLREHLDLVALGTVADVVPLVDENRILVKAGLLRLADTAKVGLQALKSVAGVSGRVTPHHVGFQLGPRLNAAGRLADATAALELLLTDDAERAVALAKLLHEHNAERQRLEEQIVEEALEQAHCQSGARVLVLADPNWHVGVIGIVASRVVQELYRPAIVIGADGKGSCRSISGFSIVRALAECAPLLERFGGHEMAAGLTVRQENIPLLFERINELAGRWLSEEDLMPAIRVDAEVRLADLDARFFAGLEQFEPCGPENPTPVFVVCNVSVRGAPQRVRGQHLRFSVTDGARTAAAIWFGAGDVGLPPAPLDVAFTAALDDYAGAPTVQLRVRDVRAASI